MNDMAMNQLFATQQAKIEEKDAEIERLKVEIFDQQEQRFWIEQRLSALLKRAADAMEAESCTEYHDLIAELRKAAE